MVEKKIKPLAGGCNGEIEIPGDKSVSHRAVMLASLGKTPVTIKNFLAGEDCLSTVGCMKAMGAKIERFSATELVVTGNGLHGLTEPTAVLDAGNSGTTLRLLMGLLAPQNFFAAFTGDSSLSKRPMARIIKPLSLMGANIAGRGENRFLPLAIIPAGKKLKGIVYESPVASAQVKSAILLAGLFADGETRVIEPYKSRNHTEEMLAAFGADIRQNGREAILRPARDDEFVAPDGITVPGDISSAAYWLTLATIVEGSSVTLKNVGVNPTRTGILDVLRQMGAKFAIQNERTSGGEKTADITVQSAKLHGISFGAEIMPRLIDEVPIIAAAALFAEGKTVITGAGELRVKETDRLKAIAEEFNKLAPNAVEETADGLIVSGGKKIVRAAADSRGDHRIAMSLAVIGSAAAGCDIKDAECADISYPIFYETLERLQY